jgi:hypothetical protein
MASTSETGHSKNVANMDELASYTLGYGPAYNPTKISIKTEALLGISSSAKKAIEMGWFALTVLNRPRDS